MTERYCLKEADIANLKAEVRNLLKDRQEDGRRLDKLEQRLENLSEMNSSLKVMALSLEHIVDHNKAQDELMKNQITTMSNINTNLNELNEGQRILNQKVEKLEERVDNNDHLNTVDLRLINKAKNESFLSKHGVPMGIAASIAVILAEIIKILFF